MDSIKKLVDIDFSKLSIQLKSRYKSSVWQHFGYLFLNEDGNNVIVSNDVYCNICFQQNKLHCYKHSSSSSNLQRHLMISHNIDICVDTEPKNITIPPAVKSEPPYLMNYEVQSKHNVCSLGDTTDCLSQSTWSNKLKVFLSNNITVNLALMCCKDLLPYNVASGSGFQQFLISSSIVSNKLQIPAPLTISEEVVSMYHLVLETVSLSFNNTEQTLSLTLEKWNEQDVIYHSWRFYFSNEMFEQMIVAMPTIIRKWPSEQYNPMREVEKLCENFKLSDKTIVVVDENINSDDTSLRTPNSLKIHHNYCIAHALNDLINIYGLSKGLENSTLVFNVHKFLPSNNFADDDMKGAWKNLDAYVQNLASRLSSIEECFISWNALIILLEYIESDSIHQSCDKSKVKQNILTEDNNIELNQLLLFLRHLRQAFEILNGTPYTSCALVLLLRAEIQRLMTLSESDCGLLKILKTNIEKVLSIKFPVTELHVCAALLDPSQRGWSSVQEYLVARHITFVEFLTLMLKKFCITEASDEFKAEESIAVENSDTKLMSFESHYSKVESPWKKAKLEILARHITCSESSEVEHEVQQYMCSFSTRGSYDEPLLWWRDQRETFPKLSRLAKIVLTIPASCSSVENISRLTRRSEVSKLSLPDDDLIKMLFIHNNSHFIEMAV